MDLYKMFQEKIEEVHTKTLHESFQSKINLTEETRVGRGRGFTGGGMARDAFKNAISNISYDLNKSHIIFQREAKFNFRNYYALDLRLDPAKLLPEWEKGTELYSQIMDKLYKDNNFEVSIIAKLKDMYSKWKELNDEETNPLRKDINNRKKYEDMMNTTTKNESRSFKSYTILKEMQEENSQSQRLRGDDAILANNSKELESKEFWTQGLNQILQNKSAKLLYDSIPTVSESGGNLIIKHRIDGKGDSEFIDMIVLGLISANRGNQPQGITISEIFSGKFGRKAIAPDKGTFINRVKDESSDQSLDYRSWKEENLEKLHEIIMNTFKRDPILKKERINVPVNKVNSHLDNETHNKLNLGPTRESIFLYITQEDFSKFAEGGKGFSKLAKGLYNMTKGYNVEL